MSVSLLDFSYLTNSIPIIARGIPITLSVTAVAFVAGMIIGLGVALVRIYRVPILTPLATFYVSFIRGTPVLVQIFLIYYGLPAFLRSMEMGSYLAKIPTIYYLYIAFSINAGAYLSETIRSSIISLPRGQFEAAYSIGMTTPQALFKIILPQALAIGLPSIGNQLIILLKNTSLAFVIGVPEIIGQAKIVAGRTSKVFEVYLVAALLYWIICLIIELGLNILEKRLTQHYRK